MSGSPSRFSAETLPDCLIQDLFLEQAVAAPERTAVISSARSLSYGTLLRESRAWAHRLRQLGVKPNTLVAVVMEKGWEQIVAVLAILEAGAAYLPIDPSFPQERVRFTLEDSRAQVALTQSWVDRRLEWPAKLTRLCVDTEPTELDDSSSHQRVQSPDDLAYVLYTSGSTGTPKGVMIAHRGIVNCILDTNRTFQIGPEDRALAVTALHHDMSVYDMFGLLAAGGAIVIPDAAGSRAPDHWVELISTHKVTLWNSVPGFMEMLLEYACGQQLHLPNRLRLAFLGGDWIPLSAPARIRKHFGDTQVVSVGGPTETTVWNIWYPVESVDPAWQSILYGHPIANTRYYILDEALHDCELGQPGEMCCAGVGLLKGYWNNDAQTKARLTVHPRTGEAIFRTGDKGRLRPDGEIEFLGRMDSQVKIHGQRIELGEIEAQLVRFVGIKQAAVKVIQSGSQKRLAAYFVTDGKGTPSAPELRSFLGGTLAGVHGAIQLHGSDVVAPECQWQSRPRRLAAAGNA